MATQAQIEANRRNAQKSTGPKTPEGKQHSRRNGLRHGLTAQTCVLIDEDPQDLLELLEDLREYYSPQNTEEEFLVERMARARFKYYRIMPLEAAIFNLRSAVDKAPPPLSEAQGLAGQRAWAYLRDANGGNGLSKLARYETAVVREYDRCRHELEKLQKSRPAGPAPPAPEKLRNEPKMEPAPTAPAPPAGKLPSFPYAPPAGNAPSTAADPQMPLSPGEDSPAPAHP